MSSRANRLCLSTTTRPNFAQAWSRGFPAGGSAHHLENRTDRDCVILELGDRTEGDEVNYPVDDIQAVLDSDGKWRFAHKTGEAY